MLDAHLVSTSCRHPYNTSPLNSMEALPRRKGRCCQHASPPPPPPPPPPPRSCISTIFIDIVVSHLGNRHLHVDLHDCLSHLVPQPIFFHQYLVSKRVCVGAAFLQVCVGGYLRFPGLSGMACWGQDLSTMQTVSRQIAMPSCLAASCHPSRQIDCDMLSGQILRSKKCSHVHPN